MQTLAFYYPVLAISTVYCIWLAYRRAQLRRERVLRDRVTFMLWAMANQVPQGGRLSAHRAAGAVRDDGALAAADHARSRRTHQPDEGRWKQRSEHGGMLQVGSASSCGSVRDWPVGGCTGKQLEKSPATFK
jgi:hypothetical protein